MPAYPPPFTVDTHLFRELGSLLVGRVSTAVVELIKNSYDADAGEVFVHGHALEDKENGYILIRDNGKGMTLKEFNEGFLRIASRGKEAGKRRSEEHERKYTGAKGIGRLATHKLAELIEITSTAQDRQGKRHQLKASIDWKAIDEKPTLDKLGRKEVSMTSIELPVKASAELGTEIKLRRLRQMWTPEELKQFLEEMQSLEPFELLTRSLSDTGWQHRILDEPLLFEKPRVRDSQDKDTFHVHLTGMFSRPGDYWDQLADSVEWVVEVDASSPDKPVRYGIAPSRSFRMHYPLVDKKIFQGPHPNPKSGPFFQARLLLRKGNWTQADKAKEWIQPKTGIRVFMEGFRVLPYGEERNDWLSIDAECTKRIKGQQLLGEELLPAEEREFKKNKQLGLTGSPNAMYLGAVFLTEKGAPSLKMVVNREGFVPDPAFDTLVTMLRTANHLLRRRRAMAKESVKPPNTGTHEHPSHPSPKDARPSSPGTPTTAAGPAHPSPRNPGGPEPVPAEPAQALAQLRLLGALGAQVFTLARVSRGLADKARSVNTALTQLLKDTASEKKVRQGLTLLQSSLRELSQGLERHAAYQESVTAPKTRLKASRRGLMEGFGEGMQLIQSLVEPRSITITSEIPATLKSPPMLPAELTCVFACLLSHAVERAATGGQIRVTGQRLADGRSRLRFESTGKAVTPQEGEREFHPHESTAVHQGLRPGLFMTRELLGQYSAEIRFTPPGAGFAAALEVIFPPSR